jgi:hypothetical protein
MNTYRIVRGVNVRRYFETTIKAASPLDAFAQARELIHPDNAPIWKPDHVGGHKVVDDLLDPILGADDSLSVEGIDRPGDDVLIDFERIPHEDEPATYGDLLAFVRRVAESGGELATAAMGLLNSDPPAPVVIAREDEEA